MLQTQAYHGSMYDNTSEVELWVLPAIPRLKLQTISEFLNHHTLGTFYQEVVLTPHCASPYCD